MPIRRLIAAALLLGAAAAQAAETLPLPAFKSIELSGGGKVVIRHGSAQRVTLLSGSTEHSRMRVEQRRGSSGRLVIEACDDRCPDGYQMSVEIVTPDIAAVAVNGGGRILVEPGFARQSDMAAAVHGGGEIDLRALPVENAAAAIDGGGLIQIRAEDSLAVAINGGGEVRYEGAPSVSSSINGGGTVHRSR
jgi:hypothetical protein